MSEEDSEFFKQIEEWFATIPDKNEKGLRNYLMGESPADAGESLTQEASTESALLIYDCDLEALRFNLRREFAESAVFNRREIKYLTKNLGLNNPQAEAVRFYALVILRNEYVKDGIKIFQKFVAKTLSATLKAIDKEGVSKTSKEFRKTSRQSKLTVAEGMGLPSVEKLKQNASLLTKTPNVGRPRDVEDKTEKIRSAVKEVLKASLGEVDGSYFKDILSGKTSEPKITKVKVAAVLRVSRPQFDEWLVRSKLNFEEQVERVQDEFYQEIRKQRASRTSD